MTRFPFSKVTIAGVERAGLQLARAFIDNGVAVTIYDPNDMRCAIARRDAEFGISALSEDGDLLVTSNANAIAITDFIIIMPILLADENDCFLATVAEHARKASRITIHNASQADLLRISTIMMSEHPTWLAGRDYTISLN